MSDLLTRAAEAVRPFARAVYYPARYRLALIRAQRSPAGPTRAVSGVFIVGCGRSGTTLLGRLLGLRPDVSYLHEPYHLWAAVDPATDFLGLYTSAAHRTFMTASDASVGDRERFARIIVGREPRGRLLVEKSPVNALRIGFVSALIADARFIHIVRDGVDVAHSIERMAAGTRRIVGRPPLNDWWGVGGTKWQLLARDGAGAGYYPDAVALLSDQTGRAAYEWLVSLAEIDCYRAQLGDRLFELRYEDLTSSPGATLRRLAAFLELPPSDAWLQRSIREVHAARHTNDAPLLLPSAMAEDFNRIQRRFGYAGRAIPSAAATVRAKTTSQ